MVYQSKLRGIKPTIVGLNWKLLVKTMSFPRMRESTLGTAFEIPAFAGMTMNAILAYL
jgi:hypothetical protein